MSKESKWSCYNHALIPSTAPHVDADIESLPYEMKKCKQAFFARWTSGFDCGYETEWWYCIKDSIFIPENLDAKKRYCITRGKREFEVRIINPMAYKDALYEVQVAAFSVYPEIYRPKVDKEVFSREIDSWGKFKVLGAFSRVNEELCGYSLIEEHKDWAKFCVQKTKPEYERLQVNAALVATICELYNSRISQGFYIVDGERNISHITGFQGYLEKYFGFRKAYCKLNMRYCPIIGAVVKLLFPMKRILQKFEKFKVVHYVVAVIEMERIRRTFL